MKAITVLPPLTGPGSRVIAPPSACAFSRTAAQVAAMAHVVVGKGFQAAGIRFALVAMGMLSRAAAGIRDNTLIVNLPGSEKAAKECLRAVIGPIGHGLEVLLGSGADCAALHRPVVRAVCISEKKGEQKHAVDQVELVEAHGIRGDAHAGDWHRQVSLLAWESIQTIQEKLPYPLKDGDFAENIVTRGIVLHTLKPGDEDWR